VAPSGCAGPGKQGCGAQELGLGCDWGRGTELGRLRDGSARRGASGARGRSDEAGAGRGIVQGAGACRRGARLWILGSLAARAAERESRGGGAEGGGCSGRRREAPASGARARVREGREGRSVGP
jgi:hypothetical protein